MTRGRYQRDAFNDRFVASDRAPLSFGGQRPGRIGVVPVAMHGLIFISLREELDRSIEKRGVLAAMIEVKMAVHYRRDATDVDACSTEHLSQRPTLGQIQLVDEVVAKADTGIDQDRTVWMHDAVAVDGDAAGARCGVRMRQPYGCQVEAHDRRHLSESVHHRSLADASLERQSCGLQAIRSPTWVPHTCWSSAGIVAKIQLYRVWEFSYSSLFDAFLFNGQSLSRQFRLLVPALGALLIRAFRFPLRRNIYNSGLAWTQITMAFAAALLALVALQPQEHNNSADGQEGVAVDGAAGEFGGAADAAEE
jgi:hypothetical protein